MNHSISFKDGIILHTPLKFYQKILLIKEIFIGSLAKVVHSICIFFSIERKLCALGVVQLT